MLKRVKAILFADPTWAEFISGLMFALWGLALVLPPPTFQSSRSFKTMAVWPEWVWAVLAFSGAACAFAGLLKNAQPLRLLALHYGVFFWGSVAVCMLADNFGSTGGLVYMGLANVCAFIAVFHKGR